MFYFENLVEVLRKHNPFFYKLKMCYKQKLRFKL